MTDLWVNLQTPEGTDMRIPTVGVAGSLANLITMLDQEIESFTQQGFNYKPQLTEQAKKVKMSYRAFLSTAIENIMCQRNPGNCYPDGIGDKLHLMSGRIDRLANMLPKRIGRVARAVIAKSVGAATGQRNYQGTAGGCQICGGRKSITPGRSTLGRAGRLNALTRRKK